MANQPTCSPTFLAQPRSSVTIISTLGARFPPPGGYMSLLMVVEQTHLEPEYRWIRRWKHDSAGDTVDNVDMERSSVLGQAKVLRIRCLTRAGFCPFISTIHESGGGGSIRTHTTGHRLAKNAGGRDESYALCLDLPSHGQPSNAFVEWHYEIL